MKNIFLATILLLAMAAAADAQENGRPSKVEEVLYHSSQVMLIGGLVWDMKTTVDAISQPTHVSYQYCQDGSQACEFPVFVDVTTSFNEAGWASSFGAHRPASVVAANAALNTSILCASHFLYTKGGKWGRVAAIGVNFIKAGDNFNAGMGNVGKMRSSRLGLVPVGAFSVSW